ncbi:MAG: helix-turn-helix domain-containing protein [Anaerolineae bacterium]
MAHQFMTPSEVAEYLRVSQPTIWRWCESGKLPAFKIGHTWRIKRDELEKMIDFMVPPAFADPPDRSPPG